MKKYFLILSVFIFCLLAVGMPLVFVVAQSPSFEVYCGTANCANYPTIENVTAQRSGDYEIIKVIGVYDVSGIASVEAYIEDPQTSGNYMNLGNRFMRDDGVFPDEVAGDRTYSLAVDVSTWPENTYWINISTTDLLLHNSLTESSGVDYVHKASFTIGTSDLNCAISTKGAMVCITNPAIVSANTTNQTLKNLTANISGNDLSLSVTLPEGALNDHVYFIDQNFGALGSVQVGGTSASLSYSYASSWTGTHVIAAIYPGNSAKSLKPSVQITVVTK